MTAPEDDLEKALREALSAAVNQVEPAADGLDRIRARTSRRPPQPWLQSIVSAAIGRARNYVWRGHWAWTQKAALLARPHRLPWHRPFVPVFAGIVFIACLSLVVPPFREAIVQVGATVLTGDSNGGTNGGGGTTNGHGTLSSGGQGSHHGTGKGSSPLASVSVSTRPATHCSARLSGKPTSSVAAAVSPSSQTSLSGTVPASPSASASGSSFPTSSSPAASPTGSTPTATAIASPTTSGTIPPATSPATGSGAPGSGTGGSENPGASSPAAALAH